MKHSRANNIPWWRRLLRSRLMLAINLVLVGFVGWSLGNEVAQGDKVSSDLNDLQTKIAVLQKQNQDFFTAENVRASAAGILEKRG